MGTTHENPRIVVYGLLFFLISFGLGYPTLNRFDARASDIDAVSYFKLVTGSPSDTDDLLRYRRLVPWVAKPFFRVGEGRLGSWNPIAFGLLVSNSLFTAAGACFLLLLGREFAGSHGAALSGTLLYLLNFTISNRQLGSGLVESGEACFMLALFWLLSNRRFYLLPALGLFGALAKESFVPMSAVATAG